LFHQHFSDDEDDIIVEALDEYYEEALASPSQAEQDYNLIPDAMLDHQYHENVVMSKEESGGEEKVLSDDDYFVSNISDDEKIKFEGTCINNSMSDEDDDILITDCLHT